MITEQQLAEWKRLAEAATPGPWNDVTACNHCDQLHVRTPSDEEHFACREGCWATKADVAFLQAARTAVPALLSEVERLQAEVEQARREERERCIAVVQAVDSCGHGDVEDAVAAIRALT